MTPTTASLEAASKETLERDAQVRAMELFGRVVSITTELFGGIRDIQESFDPANASDKYLVVVVETTLEPAAALEAELEWFKGIEEVSPNWFDLRLGVRFV